MCRITGTGLKEKLVFWVPCVRLVSIIEGIVTHISYTKGTFPTRVGLILEVRTQSTSRWVDEPFSMHDRSTTRLAPVT